MAFVRCDRWKWAPVIALVAPLAYATDPSAGNDACESEANANAVALCKILRSLPANDVDLTTCRRNGMPMRSDVCLAFRTMAATQARAAADQNKLDAEAARVEAAAQAAAQEKARALAAAQEAERARIAALPPAKEYRYDPPPPHGTRRWTWHEGQDFGYQSAISAQDTQRGIVSHPLFIVSYQGKRNGIYNFSFEQQWITCRAPCDTVIAVSAAMGRQVFPVVRGGVLWAFVEDMKNGWLADGPVTTNDPNYRPEW